MNNLLYSVQADLSWISHLSDIPESENPYWHSNGQPHSIDLETVRGICFELSSIFAASASLASQFEFIEDDDEKPEQSSLWKLHHELSEPRALGLLLQLAMLVRTYDDAMAQSDSADAYVDHAKQTDGSDFIGTLNDGDLTLREACNKIIHAQEVRAIYESVDVPGDDAEDTRRVWYLDGQVELAGTQFKKQWNAVLYVPPFLEIVLDRIAFGWGVTAAPQTE